MESARSKLQWLIGQRERAEKIAENGNTHLQIDYLRLKKEVEEFLQKHPELEECVEVIEDYFHKELC